MRGDLEGEDGEEESLETIPLFGRLCGSRVVCVFVCVHDDLIEILIANNHPSLES